MNTKHIRDYGIAVGHMTPGARNKISDVPGVTVGHFTLDDERHKTGVTVILPAQDNLFASKMTAAVHVINGFGKTCGSVQVDELGYIETPIALTNTLNVGKAADALVGWTIDRCRRDGIGCVSVNPVVGETNDCGLNDIADRALGEAEVYAAIESASADFDEGDVGAGKGTSCFGLKGGIGSASRVLTLGGTEYTVGALVQSNFGRTADLTIAGRPVGERIAAKIREYQERGDKIVYTIDTHGSNYLETQEGRNLPVPHCIKRSEGQQLDMSIRHLFRENVDKAFFKGTFGSDELFDWLREVYKLADDMDRLPFEYIELVGLLSNICVISECVLVKTACPEVPVVVDALCTASNDPKLNEAALDVMESLQIKVINR
jgi:nicotinamidase-related amidase